MSLPPDRLCAARENAVANGVAPLIRAVTADGLTHPALAERAPYDLILANILAGPLTMLAPQIAKALAPGGVAEAGQDRLQQVRLVVFDREQEVAVGLQDDPEAGAHERLVVGDEDPDHPAHCADLGAVAGPP